MKKSVQVSLTIVAAVGIASAGQRPDPCAASSFNDQACEVAIQNSGYCWNGRWVQLQYHYPYPYYYDAYQQLTAAGGKTTAMVMGNCSPPAHSMSTAHGVARAGFGTSGASCGAAHG